MNLDQTDSPRASTLTRPIPIAEQSWSGDLAPEVSVSCCAYNQESYIRDCLDGFLMQETSFPVEVLIHDDASSDGTANIIRGYEARHPQIIKAIYQTQNQFSLGKWPDRDFNFPRAQGRYIAFCEGDDYWTDPAKLQRQVEFLDAHPDYVMVAENSVWLEVSRGRQRAFSTLPERDLGVLEMLRERQFGTASVLFRNLGSRLRFDRAFGDTILWTRLAKYGKVRYRENVSSVYRRHSGGVTGGDKVAWAKQMVAWNDTLREEHPDIDRLVFVRRNLENFVAAINSLLKDGLRDQALLVAEELASLTDDAPGYGSQLRAFIEAQSKRNDE
jgi:glycosyltransferase involved in cell wall biosynthesis